ncbi:MAG: hypothetical protein ACKOFX_04435, partial [Solirubrobacterales bacterium]
MIAKSGSNGVVGIATIGRRLLLALALLAAVTVTAAGLATPSPSDAAKKSKKSSVIKVMTRNVDLGADLSGAINAPNADAFFAANGGILRQVDG